MDTFNLKDAADQSLRLLEQSGVSAKAVKEYRTTGFGAIIRHFTRQGISDSHTLAYPREFRRCPFLKEATRRRLAPFALSDILCLSTALSAHSCIPYPKALSRPTPRMRGALFPVLCTVKRH